MAWGGTNIVARRCLSHPASLLAIGVLLLNDHVLKATVGHEVPSLTGKLSDFAGLLFFPFLLALVLPGTRRTPFVITALWFAAAKATRVGHDFTVTTLSSVLGPIHVVEDPTDLIALVMIWPAWHLWRYCESVDPDQSPVGRAPVLLAALACTSTSGPIRENVGGFVPSDGVLYARLQSWQNDRPVAVDWIRWDVQSESWVSGVPSTYLAEPSPPRPMLAVSPSNSSQQYRVRPPAAIEASFDGGRTWRIEWEMTEKQRTIVKRPPSFFEPDLTVSEIALVPDGSGVVAAAFGGDSIVMRSPSGVWTRQAFGHMQPAPVPTDNVFAVIPEWSLIEALWIVVLAGVTLLIRFEARRRTGEQSPGRQSLKEGLVASFFLLPLAVITALAGEVPVLSGLVLGGWLPFLAIFVTVAGVLSVPSTPPPMARHLARAILILLAILFL